MFHIASHYFLHILKRLTDPLPVLCHVCVILTTGQPKTITLKLLRLQSAKEGLQADSASYEKKFIILMITAVKTRAFEDWRLVFS